MATRGEQATAAAGGGRSADAVSYRDVLGAGEFRVNFAADVVSMLGNFMAAVAPTVLVLVLTSLAALAARPGLSLAVMLLVISGLGSAPAARLDGLLIGTALPQDLQRATICGRSLSDNSDTGKNSWESHL